MRSKIFTRTVGYWPLQEASGRALDCSGNENHASTTNVLSYGASGPLEGSSMVFSGSGDYISTGRDFADNQNALTLSAWVNPDAVSGHNKVIGKDSDSNGRSWNLGVADGSIRFEVHGSHGVFDRGSVNTNEWVLLTGVWNGSVAKVFKNATKVGSTSSTGSISDVSSVVTIGRRNYSGNLDYFNGKIAHVRVWDYPLPEASIKALYNASRGGFSQSDSRNL